MKKHALLLLAFCGSAVLHGIAQEIPPAPPAPPVPVNHQRPRTFLGVEVSPLPSALSEQLNLPDGFGVVVDYVVPGSAADTAGIKANDILKTLDGQIVTSAEHLAVLVRSFAEGREVPLVVLHQGRETKLTATLQKRTGRDVDRDESSNGSTPDFQRQLRQSLERNRVQINAATHRAMEESRRALDEARDQTARAFDHQTDFGPARVVLRDPTGRIELRVIRGKRTLKVRDEKGETVFEGPINSPEQRRAMPADVRPQVEALEHEQQTVFPKGSEDEDDD